MGRVLKRFKIGVDFSEDDYHKWKEQLMWWIGETMPNIQAPADQAEKVLLSAMNGTKLNGEIWPNVTNNFFSRVKQLGNFDLERGIGIRKHNPRINKVNTTDPKVGPKVTTDDIPPINSKEALDMKESYVKDLVSKYQHLQNPVYTPKVEELAETIIRSKMLSREFLFANNTQLEKLNRIRESLNKQVKDLMEFLEISPSIIVKKQSEINRADVASLVSELESYGELWQDYERLDALRELIQKYHQLNHLRPDGTPQLNDWELWHMTRNRPVRFTCRCGETYTLLGGFTPEEIEEALKQAQEIYGFGLEGIEGSIEDTGKINSDVLPADFMDEKPLSPEDLEDITKEIDDDFIT